MSDPSSLSDLHPRSSRNPLLLRLLTPGPGRIVGCVVLLAFGSGAVLLANDLPWPAFSPLAHAPVSALPLLLIGLAALVFQFVIRPGLLDLFKAGIVITAFLLWGIDQLLPPGWLAVTIGDVVIVLYVIDLGWMMLDRLAFQARSHRVSLQQDASSPDLSERPTMPLHLLALSVSSAHSPSLALPPEPGSSFSEDGEKQMKTLTPLRKHRLLPLPSRLQEH